MVYAPDTSVLFLGLGIIDPSSLHRDVIADDLFDGLTDMVHGVPLGSRPHGGQVVMTQPFGEDGGAFSVKARKALGIPRGDVVKGPDV